MQQRRVDLFAIVASVALFSVCGTAGAQLAISSQFTASGGAIGVAFDHTDGTVWRYAGGAVIQHYTAAGVALPTLPRPGETANDADLEVAPVGLTLGTTAVPAGTLLFIDGETGVAEVYAVDKGTGAVLATLVTGFGASHVVGGAVHPIRGTIFLVQDRVPGDANLRSRVAEINPQTGAVLNTFQITTTLPTFTVNFGDIEVAGNGNLLVVSDDENTIAELTPSGAVVRQHTLPAGVANNLSGIGVDESGCALWVSSTSTTVWRLTLTTGGDALCAAGCAAVDINGDGALTPADVASFINAWFAGLSGGPLGGDFDRDGTVAPADVAAFVSTWFGLLSGGGC